MIHGVTTKSLVTHLDDRGFFRELIRCTDDFFAEGFGQWSLSRMYAGTVKAWHIHKIQTDWWYVAHGVILAVLHDLRPDSETRGETNEFFLGDDRDPIVLKIPPGVAHGCRCLSGPADLFYVTSHVYNPEDEGRIPHDDPDIGYDWLRPPRIR
ncbi:MAG: hypothetical protein D6679_09560 [Candidatus Hydrogenedentota bacterium]|nr:MAG: hypothetical protein D6679_09560 [Candidatus Hydrogenedentota bacterium]